jgi:hypothetical protein
MRSAFIKFATLTILISCKSSFKPREIDYNGFNDKKIYLLERDSNYGFKDSLAVLSIKVPGRLDTFYHWIDYSDYTGGQFMYYRFANRRYSVYKDFSGLGYLTKELPDSLYQLSIRYKPFKEIPDSIMKRVKIDTNEIGYKMPHPKYFNGWIKREVRKINERDFIILAYHDETWLKNLPFKIVIKACTYIDNRMLEVLGECDAKDTTAFIDNMYKSFLSIRIKEKP